MKLTVFCDDRFGMLKSITGVIGDAKSNIKNITAHTSNSQASVEVVLDISDLKHLETIIAGLQKNPRRPRSAETAENLGTAFLRRSVPSFVRTKKGLTTEAARPKFRR